MKKFFIVLTILISSFSNVANALTPRNNYGAKFEVNGKVLHGAGQSTDAFDAYYNLMPTGFKPIIYMYYQGLDQMVSKSWVESLRTELSKYPNYMLMPQIGLSMTTDGNPSLHYEDKVASGLYDNQINNLVAGLKSLGRPVFLRIGYEFNGVAWNGYGTTTYINAFKRITDALRLANVEVATVWCFATDGVANYMDYYPGNSYVDWWGIDLFSASHFSDPTSISFMNAAHTASKPVMIGETTPRYIGATDDSDWNSWFKLYFDFIDAYPGVKASCYINWNWTTYPMWSSWGDARLGQNTLVTNNYITQIQNNNYFPSSTEAEFRSTFGLSDNTKPGQVVVTGTSAANSYPVFLTWNAVADASGIAHYSIYKNGALQTFINETTYTDVTATTGEVFDLQVSAVDKAGNEGHLSVPIEFSVGNTISKALNEDFGTTIDPWFVTNYNGSVSTGEFSAGDALVKIPTSTGVDWQTQFTQLVQIKAGQKYRLEVDARASTNTPATIIMQQNHSPYSMPISKTITITTTNQTFISAEVTASADDNMNIGLFLGQASSGATIYISRITLYEIKGSATDAQKPSTPSNLTSSAQTATSIALSWTGSTDNVGVVGYDVYQGATLIGSPTTNSYVVTGLTASTLYSFTVKAKDAKPNISAASAALSVTTLANAPAGAGIATWDLVGYKIAPKTGTISSAPVTTKDAGITVSNLTLEANRTNNDPGEVQANAIGFQNHSSATLAAAVANNAYIEFTITPVIGTKVSISSLDIHFFSMDGQENTFYLFSSKKGFDVANVIGSGVSTDYRVMGTYSVTDHNDLTTAVTFRIYISNTNPGGSNGSFAGIGNRSSGTADLTVNGSVGITTSLSGINDTEFTLYPNPVVDRLSFNFASSVDKAQVTILDLQGRSLLTKSIANTQVETIDVSSLNKGVYFVKVTSNGKVTNSKFVKK